MRVLTEAEEPLHWTVIQDRALRAGYLNPFETPDVRTAVLGALRSAVAAGRLTKPAKGMYALSAYGR